ncbi:histidinol dehydrogenase [Helicobacter pylori]|nr:histidinol dehydrogenase [Helicobacter pylori]
MIEAITRPLTSHQIFLKEAKGNATNQINKTDSLEAIGQPKRAS